MGETANVGQPLFTGMSLDKLRVQTAVPQSWMPMIRQYQQADVMLSDQRRVAAQSLVFFPYADDKSHDFNVRLHLPPGIEGVFPGTLVKTVFKVGEGKRLVVPASSVVRRGELTAVYVVSGDAVALRPVLTGATQSDGSVEIVSGIRAAEQVALDPVRAGQYLQAKRAGGAS
ncbi:MAG: hypothetical protein HQL60_06325 [Magnetococcales bacterium]|nr:hypothetical protein [Magnetococcales bacterium]